MFDTFKQHICADVEEFLATRRMQRAVELSAATRQHFNHNEYPMFFVGKLDARLVLVHLNPKQRDNYAATYTGPLWLKSFDEYFEYHQSLGKKLYGTGSPQTHKSPFDHKQIRFLKPFDAIHFVEERTRDDRLANLEQVIDGKLQLELIPYGSATFSTSGFTPAILKPRLERILDVICACPRNYILFCGQIFETLFQGSIVRTHEFKLIKNDGTACQNKTRFSNLRFVYKGAVIQAGLAHSFAQQGIPMGAYGRQCKALYHA